MKRTAPSRVTSLLGTAALALTLLFAGGAPAGAVDVPAQAQARPGIDYVNLGDSYSAGFGSGELRNGPLANCVQGDGPSHVTKLAEHPKVNLLIDAACAGLKAAQVGQVATLLQAQLAEAELVTLTLGGNDLALRDLVAGCSTFGSDQLCDALVAANTAKLPGISAAVNQSLQIIDAFTDGQVIVLGYPRIFTTSGGDNAFISERNATKLNELADALNAAVAQGTTGTSAQFAPVDYMFKAHGFASGTPWIYLNAANPADPMNLHPNTAGYLRAYFPVVASQLEPR